MNIFKIIVCLVLGTYSLYAMEAPIQKNAAEILQEFSVERMRLTHMLCPEGCLHAQIQEYEEQQKQLASRYLNELKRINPIMFINVSTLEVPWRYKSTVSERKNALSNTLKNWRNEFDNVSQRQFVDEESQKRFVSMLKKSLQEQTGLTLANGDLTGYSDEALQELVNSTIL